MLFIQIYNYYKLQKLVVFFYTLQLHLLIYVSALVSHAGAWFTNVTNTETLETTCHKQFLSRICGFLPFCSQTKCISDCEMSLSNGKWAEQRFQTPTHKSTLQFDIHSYLSHLDHYIFVIYQ